MSRLTISRRRMLAQLGLASIASLPVARSGILSSRVSAQDTVPKRFISVYHPAGMRVLSRGGRFYERDTEFYNGFFFPGKTREAVPDLAALSFDDWPEENQPLYEHREDLVFVAGLENYANRGGNNHMAGMHTMLTGADPLQSYQTNGGHSLDFHIAQMDSTPATPFVGINLSIDRRTSLSSSGPTQRIPTETDPMVAYETYFGALVEGGDIEERRRELRRRAAMHRSVVDHLVPELQASRAWVSANDRHRLDAHLEAVRTMERRIGAVAMPGPRCELLDATGLPAASESIPAVVDAMHSILVAGLACGVAHTGNFAFGHGTESFTADFLPGVTEHYHELSHYGLTDTPKQEQYGALLKWTAGKVASLIQQLKDFELLEHSLLLWSTDNSNGWGHDVKDLPFVLAGQAGGTLTTGRTVSYPLRTKHNGLLLSIAHAFGEDPSTFTQYGDHEAGPLPGLF